MNQLGSFTANDRTASTTEPQLPAIRPWRDEPLPGLDELALPPVVDEQPVALCCHADGSSHPAPVDADGFALFDPDCDEDTPPTLELVRDYLDDALALVSQLVDEQLPAVRRGLDVEPWQLAAFDAMADSIAGSWAQLTTARRTAVELPRVKP